MRHVFFSSMVFWTAVSSFAQIREPIYRSVGDSLEITMLERKLDSLFAPGAIAEPRYYDSLRQILRGKREAAVVGYRYRYTPNEKYTPLRDVLENNIAPEAVTHLSIAGYRGTTLPSEVYRCTNLQAMELVGTSIRRLPRRLNRLRNLKRIALYNNHPKKALKLARNRIVNHLAIRSDDPSKLPVSYARFTLLDTLDLKRNNLTRFPDISKNRRLIQLVLAENRLTLTKRIKPNRNLQHLGLQRNEISLVPRNLAGFTGLKKLVLNYNKITDFSPEIVQLKKLEELGLYSNALKQIPPVVYALPELRSLDVYFNEIERIDPAITNLKNLEILYVASNRIYSLPENIGDLQNLRQLFIHHNRLSYLPPSIANLKNLEVLRMNANHFVTVPGWITELRNLRNLDISQNKIYQAPSLIRNLSQLELVVLTENAWENREEVVALADELATRGVIVHLEEK